MTPNTQAMSPYKAFRASILHLLDDPGLELSSDQVEYWEDGLILVKSGYIIAMGDAEPLLLELTDGYSLTEYSGQLIIPYMIDTQVGDPQADISSASGGSQIYTQVDDVPNEVKWVCELFPESHNYKVTQMRGENLSALQALYLATLSGAKALALEHKLGNLRQY